MTDPHDSSLPSLPHRADDAHKGTFGRVLVVGGAQGFTGAIILCAGGALRSGAGLVTVAAPAGVASIVPAAQPCAMTLPLPDHAGAFAATAADPIADFAQHCQALAIGPGLGCTEQTELLLERLLPRLGLPTLIDADALNVLARRSHLLDQLPSHTVLTPHPGEMRRLDPTATGSTEDERITAARRLAERTGATVVLKGHRTVVADSHRHVINQTGNPGMATGGSGDVLSGIIASIAAQGLSIFDAARLGVHVHGLAGDLAASAIGRTSLIASDLLTYLGPAFESLDGPGSQKADAR